MGHQTPGALEDWSKSTLHELLFQIDVALLARNEIAQHTLHAAMPARELDHPLSKWRSPEVSVKAAAHLCRAGQVGAKILAPPCFIRLRRIGEISVGKQLRGT